MPREKPTTGAGKKKVPAKFKPVSLKDEDLLEANEELHEYMDSRSSVHDHIDRHRVERIRRRIKRHLVRVAMEDPQVEHLIRDGLEYVRVGPQAAIVPFDVSGTYWRPSACFHTDSLKVLLDRAQGKTLKTKRNRKKGDLVRVYDPSVVMLGNRMDEYFSRANDLTYIDPMGFHGADIIVRPPADLMRAMRKGMATNLAKEAQHNPDLLKLLNETEYVVVPREMPGEKSFVYAVKDPSGHWGRGMLKDAPGYSGQVIKTESVLNRMKKLASRSAPAEGPKK